MPVKTQRYTLTEFVALLERHRPQAASALRAACVAYIRGLMGIPYTGLSVTSLPAYGRELLKYQLGTRDGKYVTPLRGLHEAHVKNVPADRIGFVWQWPHPHKKGVWVVVMVRDMHLCELAGLDPEAYCRFSEEQWRLAQLADRNESDDARYEAQAELDAQRWAQNHPLA